MNLEIQRSQYIRPKVTVHKYAENNQGRKLFKGGNYILSLIISMKIIKNTELVEYFWWLKYFNMYSIFETFYFVKKCPIFFGFVRELNQKSVCLKGTVCQQCVCYRPLCTYSGIFSPKKKVFLRYKIFFEKF